jgi:hypothetical protein
VVIPDGDPGRDDAKGFCMVEKNRTMTGMMARVAGTKAA